MAPQSSPVVVVAGATGLIGTEICKALGERGARVVGLDITGEEMPGMTLILTDGADQEAVLRAAGQVESMYGRVDWLVHAAALTGRSPGPKTNGDLRTLDIALWNGIVRANLTSALVCVQRFAALMTRSADARILFIGSIQGIVPTLDSGGYAVTKAALTGLMRQFAAEMAPDGITVNMLSPGPIADSAEIERLAASVDQGPTPMVRFGSPEEVASAVCTLMWEPLRYMTGVVIPLDGGEHLRPRHGPKRSLHTDGSSDPDDIV